MLSAPQDYGDTSVLGTQRVQMWGGLHPLAVPAVGLHPLAKADHHWDEPQGRPSWWPRAQQGDVAVSQPAVPVPRWLWM